MLLIRTGNNAYANPAFESKVVRTDFMEKGIWAAKNVLKSSSGDSSELGVWFSRALKAVENDGKNDVIKFEFKPPTIPGFATYGVLVNGREIIKERWISADNLGRRCIVEFIRFAREKLGINLEKPILPPDSNIAKLKNKLDAEKQKLQASALDILDEFVKK